MFQTQQYCRLAPKCSITALYSSSDVIIDGSVNSAISFVASLTRGSLTYDLDSSWCPPEHRELIAKQLFEDMKHFETSLVNNIAKVAY